MEIDFSKIVSANEISANTQQINTVLTGKDELFVFENNRPQFVIVSIKKYERLIADKKNRISDSEPEMKIGALVQTTFRELVKRNALSKEDVENLCKRDYSNWTFGLNFAMLKEVDLENDISIDVQKRDNKGYNRYYKDLFDIYEKKYLLCSQWYEGLQRKKYLEWLGKFDDMKNLISDT